MTGVFSLLGLFLAVLSGAMILPAAIAAASGDYTSSMTFLIGAAITAFVAGCLIFALHGVDKRMRRIEVFALAVLTWILLPVFATIPLLISGSFETFNEAIFETVSGYTTTGASVVTSLEELPGAVIAWRAILQWLGGLSTILMILLVLAPARIGGTPDRPLALIESGARTARQRVRAIASLFVPLYAGLTFICFGSLAASGVPLLDSFSLALSTISTGGFMPRDGGLGIYNSLFAESIVGIFMFVGATSVIWHRLIAKMRWRIVRQHREAYWLLAFVLMVGMIFAVGFFKGLDGPSGIGVFDSMFKGVLTALSLMSSTGYEVREGGFAAISFPILLALALIGGAGYSTAGGIKFYRMGAMFVQAGRELRRLIYPHGVRPTHFGGQAYDIQMMKSVWCSFLTFLIFVAIVTVALGFTGFGFEDALVATISAAANIGPLYQSMVPGNENWLPYTEIPSSARLLLAAAMIVGRLEILAIFAIFNVGYWRP